MIKIQLAKSVVPFDKREMETIRLRAERVAAKVGMNTTMKFKLTDHKK